MLKKVSIFWIILGALLLTSAIPLGIMAYRSIQTTSEEVEREQRQQLLNRVAAHADAINEQFRQFEITTNVAATRARELLTTDPNMTEEELDEALANYQRDALGIYGLDAYFASLDSREEIAAHPLNPALSPDNIVIGNVPAPEQYYVSDVFVNRNTELTPDLKRVIWATEHLDELFATIRREDFGTQWLYLTTDEMMRLFPFHPNQYGPPTNWAVWEPWKILFYTAAADQGILFLEKSATGDISVINSITDDRAKYFFRNPNVGASDAESCSTNSEATTCTVYVDCTNTNHPLHTTYCAAGDTGVYFVETTTSLTISTTPIDATARDALPQCFGQAFGETLCYVDCADTSDPFHGAFCNVSCTDAESHPLYSEVNQTSFTAFCEAKDPADPAGFSLPTGILQVDPITITTNPIATRIDGQRPGATPACSDEVSSTACYLDCLNTDHPLHAEFCRQTVWTAPYYDFAGQGLMVTNSLAIYDDENDLLGVMSHDLRIDVMELQVLGFEVGDEGFAFLLDRDGQIIAHQDYSPAQFALEARQGQAQFQKLAEQEEDIASIVERMTSGETDVDNYTDVNDEEWVVAFTTIPSTGWHIGLAQPRSEIIRPATNIRSQVLTGSAIMIIAVLGMSVWLATRITRPVLQLSRTAKEIEASVDSETTDIIGQNLEQLSHLSSAREISNLANVFEQMVLALQQRMTELNSIYAIGQTITANVDYDATLRAILDAIRSVVTYDAAEICILKGNTLEVEAWKGVEGFNDTVGRKYKVGRGPTGQIAEQKKPLLLSTVSSTEDIQRTLGYAADANEFLSKSTKIIINSFLGIPLLIGDRLIGTMTLFHRDEGHFTTDDERQLSKLAAQASVAIQNAIQVREREQQLKRQIEELKIEIDQAKLTREVEEVTDSDFFRSLQANAAKMRRRFSEKSEGESEEKKEE